jgi:NAD(P)-dependent dehydrogenase (short-subunit alcohol dehydrogenase family)
MSGNTTVAGKSVLVTGANRGLGRTLVEEALRRGAKRVYAASRRPLVHADARVTPLILDVTNEAQIQEAVETVESLDILINNAGISLPDDLSDRGAVDQHLAVNLFGTWGVTEAFLPSLTRTGGAIVNVVSIGAFAAVPVLPAYSISKAAAFSLTPERRAPSATAPRDIGKRRDRVQLRPLTSLSDSSARRLAGPTATTSARWPGPSARRRVTAIDGLQGCRRR